MRAKTLSQDEQEPFRVVATCLAFEPGYRAGGPVRSIARLVDTVSNSVELTLITCDRDFGSAEPYVGLSGKWVKRGRARIFYLGTKSARQWFRTLQHIRRSPPELLYVNSLWSPAFTIVPIMAARFGLIRVPRILIAPRGELSPGALSLKARKKKLFKGCWGRILSTMDTVWQASSEIEARDIQAAFPWASVIISEDQTALPEKPLQPPRGLPHARLVFISRISREKNLDMALRALHMTGDPIHFDIYGPVVDPAYWAHCTALIRGLPSTVTVAYRGELPPSEVRTTFSMYDAFVFPTRSENFGHVIAESLSASCPVVCSAETPWTSILETGGGRVLRHPDADNLGQELRKIAAATLDERMDMRTLAGKAYEQWRLQCKDQNVLNRLADVREAQKRQASSNVPKP